MKTELLPEFVHVSSTEWAASSRCAHSRTAAVVGPEPDLVGELGPPGQLFPAVAVNVGTGAFGRPRTSRALFYTAVAVARLFSLCFEESASRVLLVHPLFIDADDTRPEAAPPPQLLESDLVREI